MDLQIQKQLKGRNGCMHEEEDRITNLPDRRLIHHILSFLDIKNAARTCVLSKKWKSIWASNPNLDFLSLQKLDFENLWVQKQETKKFMGIVDRVLHLHDMSSIHKFCVRWSNHRLDESRVKLWISGVILRKVKELSLTFSAYKTFCPLPLFTCESLISLELNVLSFCKLYIPKHMSLPNLKRLKLGGVKFSNKYNNELLSLSNCTLLVDLTLENCEWLDAKNFCISAPSIETLKIISDRQDDGRLFIGREPGLRYSGLKIDAPRLVSLTYKERIPKEFVLSSSLTLAEADVDDLYFEGYFRPKTYSEEYICNATEEQKIGLGTAAIGFLRVLSHVKVLSIAEQLVQALSYADDLIKVLPTFNNSKHLNVSASESEWEVLVALFRSAPNLESLVFNKIIIHHWGKIDDDDQRDDDWEFDSTMTTGCFLHLKSVCFKQFLGHPHEMWWVVQILENAKALQTMTISVDSFHRFEPLESDEFVKDEDEIKAQLTRIFRAAATSCVLNFS